MHRSSPSLPFAACALALTLAAVGCRPKPAEPNASAGADVDRSGASSEERARADASRRVLALSDAIVDAEFEQNPERVAYLRPPGARYDRLPDDSLEAVAARARREDAWADELASQAGVALDEPARLAFGIATEVLAVRKATRVCRLELFTVSQMGGLQVRLSNLAQAQPVGTADLRAQALARFRAVPAYVDAHIANAREGIRTGYVGADVNASQVVEQLDKLLALPVRESPFFSPALRDPDPDFARAFEAVVREAIAPSLAKLRDFVRSEYLPRARSNPSIASTPGGDACYVALVRRNTSLALAPDEVHARGQAALRSITLEMEALSKKSFGGAAPRDVLARFRADAAYKYKDKADVVRRAEAAVERATAAMPRAFGLRPRANVVVEPIPSFQEKTSPAHYLAAALDGSRPAAYRIRVYRAENESFVSGESIAFHETIPGHHLQVAIAAEQDHLPRVARFLGSAAYSEGWALYSERLADELGLYSGDADRFGMLSSAAFRAARLIVDTGLHAKGWSRQRAIETLLAATALSPDNAAAEVDRYIAWPGQATAYMIGYLEIAALRLEAEGALGARFDLRSFHDAVLANGNLPLPALRARIVAWIQSRLPAPEPTAP